VAVPVLAAIVALAVFLLRRRRQRQQRDDIILPYLSDKVGRPNRSHEITPLMPPQLPSRGSEEEAGTAHPPPAVVVIAPERDSQSDDLSVVRSQREKETVLTWSGAPHARPSSAAGSSDVFVVGAPTTITRGGSPSSVNAERGSQWGEIPTPDLLNMLDARVKRGLTPQGDNPPEYDERAGQ
jgi:hypothetical protein